MPGQISSRDERASERRIVKIKKEGAATKNDGGHESFKTNERERAWRTLTLFNLYEKRGAYIPITTIGGFARAGVW